MFAKDFNLLNEIYNQRIYKEGTEAGSILDGVDAYGSNGAINQAPVRVCLKCNQAKTKCPCEAGEEDDMMFADKSEDHHESHESNGYMAKQQCFRIAKMAAMLHELIKDGEEVEPWIAAKVTQSFDDLNAVFAYKDYEQYRGEVEGVEEIEEGSEQDFIDSINRGGSNIISQIRRTVRHESTETIEKVLLECVKALEAKKKK